jgi:hypothetical protein
MPAVNRVGEDLEAQALWTVEGGKKTQSFVYLARAAAA